MILTCLTCAREWERKSGRSLHCYTCRQRRNRSNNPIVVAFHNIKNRARQRGKEFLLTIDEFTEFCLQTNYIELKGRKATDYSIDRKNDDKGYIAGNLQLLTISDNSRKQQRDNRTRKGWGVPGLEKQPNDIF
jgi:hypothetical protein